MRICALPYNLTVSVANYEAAGLGSFDSKKKQFSGPFASAILRSFYLMKKNE